MPGARCFAGSCASGTVLLAGAVLRRPLVRAGRALGQLPFVLEQVLEEVVAPLRRRRRPRDLDAARDRVAAVTLAERVRPAEALVHHARRLGIEADVLGRIAGAMGLAERVTAGDQRDGLLVVHRHARERLANVACRRDRIRLAVRTLRVDVDETHLDRGERLLEIAITGVALVLEPLLLRAPVDIHLGLPDVLATAAEAEGLKAHRLERDVAGEDHQIRPRDLLAVLLLDRPQQAPRLVEVDVVGPRVERREALAALAGATATIAGAVRAGAVPRHANEQRAVVTEVGGPPVLRVGHQRAQVLLQRGVVERRELASRSRTRHPSGWRATSAGAASRVAVDWATSRGSSFRRRPDA